MNEESAVDLLDLDVDDGATMDTLPDATPFMSPRPKKPWLLLGVGVLVIVLATYIIVHTVTSDSSSSIDVDLDVPTVVIDGGDAVGINPDKVPVDNVSPKTPKDVPLGIMGAVPIPQPEKKSVVPPVPLQKPEPVPAPKSAPMAEKPNESMVMPVRVIEDRKETTFNPDKPAVKHKQPASKKAGTAKSVKKSTPKPQVAPKGSWYVQFGSYSTRALAEDAQRKVRKEHSGLFQGKQFVILAATLPNGQTVYRLRIAFTSSDEANGFCRNAKSDGLDCYVAK